MSSRTSRAVSVAILLAFLGCGSGAVLLTFANREVGRGSIWFIASTAAFVIVGALITARQPDNRIGWLFGAIGLVWASGAFAVEYSVYGVVTKPGAVPAPWLGAWYGEWNWIVFWFLALVTTPMVFPTGRALSPRWQWALRGILVAAGVFLILAMLDPSLEIEGSSREVANPLGASFGLDPDDAGPGQLLIPLMLASAIVAAISVVLRFRTSRGDERLQMKWFTFGATLLAVCFVALAFLDGVFGIKSDFLYGVGLTMVPLGAGIGILRYHLYDIDVVINRALVYLGLTTVLGGAYIGLVVLLQQALTPFTDESDVSVAASTLAVAGLFRPARARVQGFIDRRFYRNKYDSAKILDAFSKRLRDEVKLDELQANLLGAVRQTVAPEHAALWLRNAPEISR